MKTDIKPYLHKKNQVKSQDPSWKIGKTLKNIRESERIDIVKLVRLIKGSYPKAQVTTARIAAIESNASVPDLQELVLICQALSKGISELLSPIWPWILFKNEFIQKAFERAKRGIPKLVRIRGAHEIMIEQFSKYTYVPLDEEYFPKKLEKEGVLHPTMHIYLFDVKYADDATMDLGLDSHEGEEIIYILEGELEFWLKQHGPNREIKKIQLRSGDCLRYSSRLLHGYRSESRDKDARALFIYTDPPNFTTPQFVKVPNWRK